MSTDLMMLALSCLLCMLLPYGYVIPVILAPGGLEYGLGNRETTFQGTPPWVDRLKRAHANLVENLVVFAALVMLAHVTGRADEWTAIGSQMFFWGRVGHALTYVAGLVPWRTLVFAVSVLGEWIILMRILA